MSASMLPKVKNKKIIKKDFVTLAEKVRKIFEEEAKFLREKKMNDENLISSDTHSFT